MASPPMKTPFAPIPLPESERPITFGPTMSELPPLTRQLLWLTACDPRSRIALLFAASRMVPPFRVSAEAPTSYPKGSESEDCTV